MGEPDDNAEGPTERLQAGPSRPPLLPPVPARWRQRAVAPLAFVLGIAAGAGTVLALQDEPSAPSRARVDEHDVELILFEVQPPRTGSQTRPLRVDGAFLLSGVVASTVSRIGTSNDSLHIRAPELPVAVSPTDRFQSVVLSIRVRDCEQATRWSPTDRPFTIAWRDEFGQAHVDRAGDFSTATGDALSGYIAAVCES